MAVSNHKVSLNMPAGCFSHERVIGLQCMGAMSGELVTGQKLVFVWSLGDAGPDKQNNVASPACLSAFLNAHSCAHDSTEPNSITG